MQKIKKLKLKANEEPAKLGGIQNNEVISTIKSHIKETHKYRAELRQSQRSNLIVRLSSNSQNGSNRSLGSNETD